MSFPQVVSANIAISTALSGEADLGGNTLVGIAMPAGWDAAALTFQISVDGTTFLEMQGAAAVISYTAAAGQYIAVDPALWRGVVAVKVRSGTSGSPVNQTAARAIGLVAKSLA